MVDYFPTIFNLNRFFLKLNRFICKLPVLSDHRSWTLNPKCRSTIIFGVWRARCLPRPSPRLFMRCGTTCIYEVVIWSQWPYAWPYTPITNWVHIQLSACHGSFSNLMNSAIGIVLRQSDEFLARRMVEKKIWKRFEKRWKTNHSVQNSHSHYFNHHTPPCTPRNKKMQ